MRFNRYITLESVKSALGWVLRAVLILLAFLGAVLNTACAPVGDMGHSNNVYDCTGVDTPNLLQLAPASASVRNLPLNVNNQMLLLAYGNHFSSHSHVLFGDSVVETAYFNSGSLQAFVPRELVLKEGTYDIRVLNTDVSVDCTAQSSKPITFTVTP